MTRLSRRRPKHTPAGALAAPFIILASLGTLSHAAAQTVPIYDTYQDMIKELRDWARNRTRPASVDIKMAELFD